MLGFGRLLLKTKVKVRLIFCFANIRNVKRSSLTYPDSYRDSEGACLCTHLYGNRYALNSVELYILQDAQPLPSPKRGNQGKIHACISAFSIRKIVAIQLLPKLHGGGFRLWFPRFGDGRG